MNNQSALPFNMYQHIGIYRKCTLLATRMKKVLPDSTPTHYIASLKDLCQIHKQVNLCSTSQLSQVTQKQIAQLEAYSSCENLEDIQLDQLQSQLVLLILKDLQELIFQSHLFPGQDFFTYEQMTHLNQETTLYLNMGEALYILCMVLCTVTAIMSYLSPDALRPMYQSILLILDMEEQLLNKNKADC